MFPAVDRIEKDLLGEMAVPEHAYWGIHTERAIRNFPVSGRPVHPSLIEAMALVKKACCLANADTGHLPGRKAGTIARACDEIAEGRCAPSWRRNWAPPSWRRFSPPII